MNIQEITFHAPVKNKGSNRTQINVDVDGSPFGAIWTYTAKGEVHPYHVNALDGRYGQVNTKEEAIETMRVWAGE